MSLRMSLLLFALGQGSLAVAAPNVIRVRPETAPAHIQIAVTASGCETKRLNDEHVAIWYATAKARVVDLKSEPVSVAVQLRDPRTDAFLFNPGTGSVVEGDYLIASIAFNSTILDQIVFQWREGDTIYEIYLRDFYSGERC